MAKTSAIPGWQLALLILTGTTVGVVVIMCLYWARTVFIPVALAVFLTFLLAPLVTALQRHGLRRFFSVIAVVLLTGMLLAGGIWLVTAALAAIVRILPSSLTPQGFPLWRTVTLIVSWAFLTLAIALVYRILPDAKIAWRDVWIGAGVSALLFLLGNHLIGWYLAATSVTSVYGAAGSIVIVLLWVYYSSQVVLFGAEFTRVFAKHRGAPLQPKEHAVRVNPKGDI